MKKLIAVLLIVSLQAPVFASYIDKQVKDAKKNAKYNTVQIHKKSYEELLLKEEKAIKKDIKDPGLVKMPVVNPVNKSDYDNKLKKDESIYNSKIKPAINKNTKTVNIEPNSVDFYIVYRTAERLIRANNLDYVNWRIAIRKSEDFNASSYEGNYIKINTALYDTFYDNEDALAFVIAHEMAHHIFGHAQRKLDRRKTVKKLAIPIGLLCYVGVGYLIPKMFANEDQLMEYMADAEALKLLMTAGFSPDNAFSALTFMESLPNYESFYASHPIPKKRIESLKENYEYAEPAWVDVGKNNILNSEVLDCKKSSDRVSIVISRSKKADKFYEPETTEQYLTRVAYKSYQRGNMTDAAKRFRMLAKLKEVDFVPYLYLSYANEYNYKETKDVKFLKWAKKAAAKAYELNSNNKYVVEQYKLLNLENSSSGDL